MAFHGQDLWNERKSTIKYQSTFLKEVPKYVRFYKKVLKGCKDRKLSNFPIITKDDVVNNYGDFFSSLFNRDDFRYITTSGTTGTPLRVGRDIASWYGFAYDCYKEIHNRIMKKQKFVSGSLGIVVLNDNPIRRHLSLINPSLNNCFMYKLVLGKDNTNDKKILEFLNSKMIPLLVGRPRTLLTLADLRKKSPKSCQINPNYILCSGDNLHPDEKEKIETNFNSTVYNAYTTVEGGLIGIECKISNEIHVITSRAFLEIHEKDKSISPEGRGYLIVTNFENFGMPFVRYNTFDKGEIKFTKCDCGHQGQSIVNLFGRESTFFSVKGKKIPPTYLNIIFENLPIKRYQIIQKSSTSFHVRIYPFNRKIQLRDTIINEFKKKFEDDVSLSIEELFDDVTGKKSPRYMNEYENIKYN